MVAGDFGLYREVGGGTSFGQPGTAIDLDTTDLEESVFSRSGGEVTVKEACRVLCFAGMEAEKDTGGAETALMRVEVDPATGTFLAEPGSYCQGYFSDLNGVVRAPMACVTIIDAVANSKIRLFAETKTSSVLERAARTFLQLYQLPSHLQVAHLLRSSNLNTIGTTYVDVPWNSEIIKDSSWTHSNSTVPAEVTWTGPASRVLVLFSLTVSNPTGTSPDRLAVGAHVLKNGSAVDFSQVTGHIRGTGDDINTTLRLAIPIDLATSDVLKVQIKVFARPGSQTARVVSNRATMTVIALPGSLSWLQMRNSADQSANGSSLDFACNTEDEKGTAFSHSNSTNNSELTVKRAHRYLLGYKVGIDRGASATADNIAWDSFFRKNNSTDLGTRGGGGFSEGTQASVAYRESSITGAIVIVGVVDDIYKLRIDKIGSGADSNANFLGGTGETKSLIWALDLDELVGVRGRTLSSAASIAKLQLQNTLNSRTMGSAASKASLPLLHDARVRTISGAFGRAQALCDRNLRSRTMSMTSTRIEIRLANNVSSRTLSSSFAKTTLKSIAGIVGRSSNAQFGQLVLDIIGSNLLEIIGRCIGLSYGRLVGNTDRGLISRTVPISFAKLSANNSLSIVGKSNSPIYGRAKLQRTLGIVGRTENIQFAQLILEIINGGAGNPVQLAGRSIGIGYSRAFLNLVQGICLDIDTEFDLELLESVAEILASSISQTITINRYDRSYSPTTRSTVETLISSTQLRSTTLFSYRHQYKPDTIVKDSDALIFIAGDYQPTLNSVVLIGGDRWSIVHIKAFYSGRRVAIYQLSIRSLGEYFPTIANNADEFEISTDTYNQLQELGKTAHFKTRLQTPYSTISRSIQYSDLAEYCKKITPPVDEVIYENGSLRQTGRVKTGIASKDLEFTPNLNQVILLDNVSYNIVEVNPIWFGSIVVYFEIWISR